MKLEYLFSYNAELTAPLHIGQGNFGVRDIIPVKEGRVWGPKLNGKLLPLGGEFQLSDSAGRTNVDVRIVIETDDEALIYVQYNGIAELTDDAKKIVRDKGCTEFADTYFVTRPVLETGHEKYRWLNGIVCVAEGRVAAPNAVEYRVYQCLPTKDLPAENSPKNK